MYNKTKMFGGIAILFFFFIFTGCDIKKDTSNPQLNDMGYEVNSSVPINKNNELYQKLMKSDAMNSYQSSAQTNFGELNLDNAYLVTYKGTDVTMIRIPLINQTYPGRYMLAYYSKMKDKFGTFLLDISNLQMESNNNRSVESISGSIMLYSETGELITGAIYQNDKLLDTIAPAVSRDYWSCVGSCVLEKWDQLPLWLKIVCGGVCLVSCATGVGCSICIDCIGGWSHIIDCVILRCLYK